MSFINGQRGRWGVEPICRVLEVAPSTYYAAASRRPCARQVRDQALKPEIARVQQDNCGVYGAHKVWRQLNRDGFEVGRDRVRRLMRRLQLAGVWRGQAEADHPPRRGRRTAPGSGRTQLRGGSEPALGSRPHLCQRLDRLRLRGFGGRCLQSPDRRLAGAGLTARTRWRWMLSRRRSRSAAPNSSRASFITPTAVFSTWPSAIPSAWLRRARSARSSTIVSATPPTSHESNPPNLQKTQRGSLVASLQFEDHVGVQCRFSPPAVRWISKARFTPNPGSLRRGQMRFMVIVKANEESEAGVLPDQEILTEMGKYNEELTKAGVMLAGEGLHPSSKGARVRFEGGRRTVTDGPFAETKELVAGFWLIEVKSKEEAIEWVKRAPFDGGTEIEIRQVFEADDFGDVMTPELREQEERLRAQAAQKR
ncbi:MAG: IS3 family transposase [Candidatus Dormibacteraeota bacterium]|uniref:IS3 family transposase n=2 Tax=Candidatus Dormiibacter inghamiae TaxID=3127013 RepID=A0A934NH49_9BACT|nr:IS3 family transposase [Candidatus Dormibacteraeota bacterium]MBJ7606029.1 IS3 family transposase [Candidatus Dormibacteraeota bacterium]